MAKKRKNLSDKLTCDKCKKSFTSLKYLRGHYCTKTPLKNLKPFNPKE